MDAVITYVNSEDKTWREEYGKHVKSTIEEARYRDWGTLQYLIKGIRQFMPFIENIYLVVSTPSQITGIDVSEVNVVYHKEIIPEKYLPTFNSCTIEMFLHKIPGLSEEFIYFNDDTFVIKPMKKTDFFVDDKPVLNPHLQKCSQFDINSIFVQQCKNSTELIRSKFVKKYPINVFIRQEHIMRPMLKSTYEVVWETCEKEIINSLTRIRTKRNYNAYLFNNYDVMKGYYVQKELPYKYIKTSDSINSIISDITSDKFSVVCINDSGAVCKNDKDAINGAFENAITKKEPNNVKQKSLVLKDKLYVSFTSWEKRINNCKHTVDLMSSQTLKPTKIILNLAEEEFPNKENDLPKDLVAEAKNNPLFEIYWVKENTTVWKKILPTMNRFPNDLVLSIDDDIEYPDNYIEEMYKTFINNKKLYPVVAYKNIQNNRLYHAGPFTLTNYHFYGKYIDVLYNELVYPTLKDIKWASDNVYSEALFLNHNKYVLCTTINGKDLYLSSYLNKQNAYSNYTGSKCKETFKLTKNMLSDFINTRFNKPDLSNKKVVVSFTTWKQRDMYVEEMLTCFQQQTLKPYKIICWIAKDEYEGKIPDTLQKCLDKKLLSEIRWVDKNIYGHKRYEIFKDPEFENCYIATIDDDLYYPINHLENLLEISVKHPDCVCSYFSRTVNYVHGFRKLEPFENTNIKNEIYSGLSLYPPHVFPIESFKYEDLRNKYCLKCDDSWINAWLKKKNIKVTVFEEWHDKCLNTIEGTVEGGIWNTHNNIKINGNIIQLYYNRMTALKCIGAEDITKKLWPECDIDKYNTMNS